MGFLMGAIVGFGVHTYTNAVRRLPLMHEPWKHLIAIGIGGAAGVRLTQLREEYLVEFRREMETRGRPIPPKYEDPAKLYAEAA